MTTQAWMHPDTLDRLRRLVPVEADRAVVTTTVGTLNSIPMYTDCAMAPDVIEGRPTTGQPHSCGGTCSRASTETAEHDIENVIRTHPIYDECSDRWCHTHQTWADSEGHPFEGKRLCVICSDEKRWHDSEDKFP